MTNPHFNLTVVERQSFGGMFKSSSSDRAAADRILSGKLKIQPHPDWDLPDPVLWDANPFGQRNWQAQFHMLRWMEPVRRVALTGDAVARRYWLNTCRSWVLANPPALSELNYDAGTFDYAWADMVEAIRALCMTFALPLVRDGEDGWLADSLVEHGEWLAEPSHLGRANHALHQHQALFVLGSVFDRRDWTDAATTRLTELFLASYDEEGVNAEGSIAYHKNNFVWWDTAFERLDLEGVPRPAAADRLRLAALELAHATKPDGTFERIGDTDLSSPGALTSPELEYVKTSGATGQPPAELTKVYRRGYVFGRSGWGAHERSFDHETFYSLSFGSAARVHGHQDGASVTLHSNGHPWLIDSGKYAYNKDEMRSYCLSRMGHNVVHIEGKHYHPGSVVELVRFSLTDDIDDFSFIDRGYDGVELRRRVTYCRGGDFFVVVDTVLAEDEVSAVQRWHLDSATTVTQTSDGYTLARGDGTARIMWRGNLPEFSIVRGSTKPFDGWMASDWMKKEASPVIGASKRGRRFRFITVIAAPQSGSFELTKLESDSAGILVRAVSGRQRFNLAIGLDSASVSTGLRENAFRDSKDAVDLARSRAVILVDALDGYSLSPVPQSPNATFSTQYGADLRRWIARAGNQRIARLAALTVLLPMMVDLPSDTANDQGLRATIIDVLGHDLAEELSLDPSMLGVMREPLSNWTGDSSFASSTYDSNICNIDSPEEIFVPDQGQQILAAHVGGLVLPIVVGRGSSDVLSIRFHGAINRTKTTLPVFQGLTSEIKSGDSFGIFQDPSLDLNRKMTLSWYLGEESLNMHEYMARCIERLQEVTQATSVLLSGSSGGGFTALQVASYLPHAAVLAFNPQTDVHSYFKSSACTALESCFRLSADKQDRALAERISAVERYRNLNFLPRVTYVQNIQDIHHLENHRRPFEEMLREHHSSALERISFVDVDWGPGHVAATADTYAEFRKTVVGQL